MPLARFDTPGRLRDAPERSTFYGEWDGFVRLLFGPDNPGAPDIDDPSGRLGGFYNPATTDVAVVANRDLIWMGFPRPLLVGDQSGRHGAFPASDTRDRSDRTTGGQSTQVEYLEWHVVRRPQDNKITKVTFTTETPEYWSELHRVHPEVVLRLYRELLGNPSIEEEEIAPEGFYEPLNDWNTRDGIIHYIVASPPNTLGQAIGQARGSVAGVSYRDNYETPGGDTTAVDPRIRLDLKALARKNLWVTLRDPVGLYILGWDDTGWTKPDDSPVGNYWRVVRPASEPALPALRVEYEVPASEGFVVGDISIGGRPIEYGGQLAEHITVLIGGLAGTRS